MRDADGRASKPIAASTASTGPRAPRRWCRYAQVLAGSRRRISQAIRLHPDARAGEVVRGAPGRPARHGARGLNTVTAGQRASLPSLLLILNESGGSRFEQRMRRVGESAAEIAIHRDHGRLLKLRAHDDEVGAAQACRRTTAARARATASGCASPLPQISSTNLRHVATRR